MGSGENPPFLEISGVAQLQKGMRNFSVSTDTMRTTTMGDSNVRAAKKWYAPQDVHLRNFVRHQTRMPFPEHEILNIRQKYIDPATLAPRH